MRRGTAVAAAQGELSVGRTLSVGRKLSMQAPSFLAGLGRGRADGVLGGVWDRGGPARKRKRAQTSDDPILSRRRILELPIPSLVAGSSV